MLNLQTHDNKSRAQQAQQQQFEQVAPQLRGKTPKWSNDDTTEPTEFWLIGISHTSFFGQPQSCWWSWRGRALRAQLIFYRRCGSRDVTTSRSTTHTLLLFLSAFFFLFCQALTFYFQFSGGGGGGPEGEKNRRKKNRKYIFRIVAGIFGPFWGSLWAPNMGPFRYHFGTFLAHFFWCFTSFSGFWWWFGGFNAKLSKIMQDKAIICIVMPKNMVTNLQKCPLFRPIKKEGKNPQTSAKIPQKYVKLCKKICRVQK